MQKIIIAFFLFFNIVSISTFADSGLVKFINHAHESFSINNTDQQKSAQLIGLPISIPADTDKNYHITLSNADVGSHYQYESDNGKLHFSINVRSKQTFIHHHSTFQTVDYLTVNWENCLQDSDIHYVLPLFWNDSSYLNGQAVRVDSHNNAIIGIFSQEPKNVLTVMSYNTDKDGTGTDHNPQYQNPLNKKPLQQCIQ